MSHHFDTKLAKEDPSLNVCDLYLFQGAPDTTVMAMTVNPDVVLSAPDTLHIEGLYAFRLDLTGDVAKTLSSSSGSTNRDMPTGTRMSMFRAFRSVEPLARL